MSKRQVPVEIQDYNCGFNFYRYISDGIYISADERLYDIINKNVNYTISTFVMKKMEKNRLVIVLCVELIYLLISLVMLINLLIIIPSR